MKILLIGFGSCPRPSPKASPSKSHTHCVVWTRSSSSPPSYSIFTAMVLNLHRPELWIHGVFAELWTRSSIFSVSVVVLYLHHRGPLLLSFLSLSSSPIFTDMSFVSSINFFCLIRTER
ncbi:unnamed protein product [Brassica oleracea]